MLFDLFVKPGTPAGSIQGTVEVSLAGAAASVKLPITVRVRNFELPSISEFATTFSCETKSILSGIFLKDIPRNITSEEQIGWQKQYVDLGLMHRVTFSDFLGADGGLALSNGTNMHPSPDWEAVEAAWGKCEYAS